MKLQGNLISNHLHSKHTHAGGYLWNALPALILWRHQKNKNSLISVFNSFSLLPIPNMPNTSKTCQSKKKQHGYRSNYPSLDFPMHHAAQDGVD